LLGRGQRRLQLVVVAGGRGRRRTQVGEGTGLRAALEAACARAGFAPQVAYEASEPYVLGQLAARGLGLAVLPESAVAGAASQLRVLEVTEPALRGRMGVVWRAEGPMSPAARAFIEHARRHLPDLGKPGGAAAFAG
ncbi:LysR substrate-binding domain-containing protein, partial [Nonomuraea fuscirosea]|uniref:LysR substrate-binding domain-containing protein n=1 Tax=Nonomuraea fuscirosea TaxID=1291556 RepID=UPI003446920F